MIFFKLDIMLQVNEKLMVTVFLPELIFKIVG